MARHSIMDEDMGDRRMSGVTRVYIGPTDKSCGDCKYYTGLGWCAWRHEKAYDDDAACLEWKEERKDEE